MPLRTLTRCAIAVAALALLSTTLPAAQAATSYSSRRASAATWQAGQLRGTGRIPASTGSGADWGVTIDTMFELPSMEGVDEVMIDKDVVGGNKEPIRVFAKKAKEAPGAA